MDIELVIPRGHFYIVSVVAILSLIVSIAVGISGIRLRNMNVIFLSLAYISLTEMFAVHGLSTPGFIMEASNLPGMAAQLSIVFSAIWLWLSSLPSDHPLVTYLSQWKTLLVPVWTLLLAVVGILFMGFPQLASVIPINQNPIKWFVTIGVIVLVLVSMYRYLQSYRFTQFPLQIAIVYSTSWLITSQIIMVLGELWKISWWLYHFLLLFSVIMMLIGIVRQYAVKSSITMAIKSLFITDPVERIEASISPSIKALVVATEAKDKYTAGHNYRVALFALKIGEEIGLEPEQLRALAHGGVVHDVGKIQVPDQILNKPGKLTDEERAIIERHPVTGEEMCKRLGFMKEELEIIRSHHEKWNGQGYPDKLSGEQIPLLARILAVADVYDALTSSRSYREAWSGEKAMELINEQKGIHFDPNCVEAWARVCERDPETYLYPDKLFAEENIP